MFYPRTSFFLCIFVHNTAAGDPGNLRPGGYIEIVDNLIVKGHDLQNGRHELKKSAFTRLLKRARKRAPRHSVICDRMVKPLERRFSPFIVAYPLPDFQHCFLCHFPVQVHVYSRFFEVSLH